MMDMRTIRFTASGFNREEFEHLHKALRAMGVDLRIRPSGDWRACAVTVTVPASIDDAERKRTRGAGRPHKGLSIPQSSPFTDDTTIHEFMKWRRSHTAKEAQEALGLAPTTYYRRMKRLRELAEWERVNNPLRASGGLPEQRFKLGDL